MKQFGLKINDEDQQELLAIKALEEVDEEDSFILDNDWHQFFSDDEIQQAITSIVKGEEENGFNDYQDSRIENKRGSSRNNVKKRNLKSLQ